MAEPTPTQLVRLALTTIEVLKNDIANLQQFVADAELSKHRERTAVLEYQVAQLLALMEEHKPTRAEAEILGALKIRMTQLEEEKKRDQTRVFQVMILFLGGIITLAIQIVLLFFKK